MLNLSVQGHKVYRTQQVIVRPAIVNGLHKFTVIIIIIISSSSSSSSSGSSNSNSNSNSSIVVVVVFLWLYAYVTPRITISNPQQSANRMHIICHLHLFYSKLFDVLPDDEPIRFETRRSFIVLL